EFCARPIARRTGQAPGTGDSTRRSSARPIASWRPCLAMAGRLGGDSERVVSFLVTLLTLGGGYYVWRASRKADVLTSDVAAARRTRATSARRASISSARASHRSL